MSCVVRIWVRELRIKGEIPCFKAGRKYLISEEALIKAVFGDIAGDEQKK